VSRSTRACLWRFWAALLPALVGCAPMTNVVLLPQPDGRPASVVVAKGEQQVVLARPYEAARESSAGVSAYASSAQEVQQRFGPALAAQPGRAAKVTLYFVEGKDALTEESRALVDNMLAEVARRPVPDVLVVGHTDLVGSHASNDALAQRRGEVIRTELVRLGVPAENIQVIARGKREPAIPTADGVAEPRNRRVEIIVR